jgi:hypothetical protein
MIFSALLLMFIVLIEKIQIALEKKLQKLIFSVHKESQSTNMDDYDTTSMSIDHP